MRSLETEAVTHLSYGSDQPTVFELTDPRTSCGATVRIRKGNETYRITQINVLDATGEVEIKCEDD